MKQSKPKLLTAEEIGRRIFIRDKKEGDPDVKKFTWKTLPPDIKKSCVADGRHYINFISLEDWPPFLWDKNNQKE